MSNLELQMKGLGLNDSKSGHSTCGPSDDGTAFVNPTTPIYTSSHTTEGETSGESANEEEPPPALSPIKPIVETYDLIIELGQIDWIDGCAFRGFTWGVSQAAMCLSSPFFAKLLNDNGEHPSIERFVRNGVTVLRMNSPNTFGMGDTVCCLDNQTLHMDSLLLMGFCMFRPIHFSAEMVPQKVEVEMLARICVFAHKYQLLYPLKGWFMVWMQNLDVPKSLPVDLHSWLVISGVLGDEETFNSCQVLFWWHGNEPDPVFTRGIYSEALWPFLDHIAPLMENSIRGVYKKLHNIYQILAEDYPDIWSFQLDEANQERYPECQSIGEGCTHMRLWSLTKQVNNLRVNGWFGMRTIFDSEQEACCNYERNLEHLWADITFAGSESLRSPHEAHSRLDAMRRNLRQPVHTTANDCTKRFIEFYTHKFNTYIVQEFDGIVRKGMMKPFGSNIAALRKEQVQKATWLKMKVPVMTLKMPVHNPQ